MKIIFAGTPEFAATHLASIAESHHELAAVITPPDKPGKRGRQPVASPVKHLATDLGLDVRQPRRLVANDIADLGADLLLVVAYGQILRSDVLQLPKKGCINVHASLLPRWRGAAPIQRAILAGDTETGVCIMQMDEGLDTGGILLQQTVPILEDDTTLSLTSRLSEVGPPVLLKAMEQIDADTSYITPQPDEGMTYAKKISKDDLGSGSQSLETLENLGSQRSRIPDGTLQGPHLIRSPLSICIMRVLQCSVRSSPGTLNPDPEPGP